MQHQPGGPGRYHPGLSARATNRCTPRSAALASSLGGSDRHPVMDRGHDHGSQARERIHEHLIGQHRNGPFVTKSESAARRPGGDGFMVVSSLRRSARHRRAVIRSPRAAYQRGPSSCRKAGAPMALADDAADRPRGQVKHGSGPAFGAGPSAPGQPCQACEQAGVVQQGDPGPRRRTGTIRCPVRLDASSEGTANRLDRVRNDGRTSGNRTAHAGRLRNPGSIRPLWKH